MGQIILPFGGVDVAPEHACRFFFRCQCGMLECTSCKKRQVEPPEHEFGIKTVVWRCGCEDVVHLLRPLALPGGRREHYSQPGEPQHAWPYGEAWCGRNMIYLAERPRFERDGTLNMAWSPPDPDDPGDPFVRDNALYNDVTQIQLQDLQLIRWECLPAVAQCPDCRAKSPGGRWDRFAPEELITHVETTLLVFAHTELFTMAQLPKDPFELFDNLIPKGLERAPDKAIALNAVYLFRVLGADGGDWTIDCTEKPPTCRRGDTGKAQCTLEFQKEDFATILTDPSAGMQLYFQGRFRVSGDPSLALKLQQLFELARPA